jgi:hypothetical protein
MFPARIVLECSIDCAANPCCVNRGEVTTALQTFRRLDGGKEEDTAVSLASRDTYIVTRLILSALTYQCFRNFKRKLLLQLFLDILQGILSKFLEG